MQRVKFRAWQDNHMIYQEGSDVQSALEFCKKLYYDLKPWYVMQFTGLYDKNGKDIFAEDIVRFQPSHGKERIGIVHWNRYEHYVTHWENKRNYICSTWDMAKNYGGEVIGNIYEHENILIK